MKFTKILFLYEITITSTFILKRYREEYKLVYIKE